MPRQLATAALVATAAIFLAGCFTIESTFTISDHGTVDVESTTLIDTEQLSDMAGMFGEDADDIGAMDPSQLMDEFFSGDDDPCSDLAGSLSGYDVSTEEISDGDRKGVSCTVSDVPIDKLNDMGSDSTLSIEQDGSGTRFEMTLDGVDELTGEAGGMTDIPGMNLDDLFTINFIVSAPGSLGDNNATSTSGSTATWKITPDADFITDGSARLTAQWSPSSGSESSALWIVLAVIAGLIVIGVIVWLVMRGRSGSDGPPPSGGVPFQPPAPAGPGGLAPPGAPPAAPGPPSAPPPPAPPTSPPGSVPPPPPA